MTEIYQSFAEMRLKAAARERFALPDVAYPLSAEALDLALGASGEHPFSDMLHGLQERSAAGDAGWRSLESALAGLAALIAPADGREAITAGGDEWWIEIGCVDLGEAVVTVQRQNELVAALAKRDDGRLRLAAYRPLDARSDVPPVSSST